MKKNSAILLAAGSGTRYKGKKQDIVFRGKPLWKYVFDTVAEVVEENRIVVVGKTVPGGKTRSESVICGLHALPDDSERVIVVEAARPLILPDQVRQLLSDDHPSVSFVRPLVNTVIYRDGRYLNRNDLYDLLTPQAFDYTLLRQAYDSGRFTDTTDETRVMYEYHGIRPYFIETGSNLYKVTYPGDMDMIEHLYRQLQEGKEKT